MADELDWSGTIVEGVPATAGEVSLRLAVAYDPEGLPPSALPDESGIALSWAGSHKELSAATTITVLPGSAGAITPGQAIDAVLADAKFVDWLDETDSTTWSNANVFLTSSPKGAGIAPVGPAWDIELFRGTDGAREWAIGFVDPLTAKLLGINYCNSPCDH